MTGVVLEFHEDWTAGQLSSLVFTSEQLYTLIGGPYFSRFMIPESLVPIGYMGDESVMAEMKAKLVSFFAPLGVVDRDGVPCPALEALIEPIRDCMFDVSDAPMPSDDSEDERSWSICLGAHSATVATISSEPYRVGYSLRGLGSPDCWESAFAQLTGLGNTFHYASQPCGFACDGKRESKLLLKMSKGAAWAATELASVKGVPADLLRFFR